MNTNSKTYYILGGKIILNVKALENVDSSKISYSIPISYGPQIPLILNVDGDLKSYKIIDEKGIPNKIIQFEVPSLKKDEEIKTSFDFFVLVDNSAYRNIPSVMQIPDKNDIPDSEQKWLYPSKPIQSESIFIKIASRLFQGFSKNLMWISKKIVFWNAYHGIYFNFFKKFVVNHAILNRIFIPDKYWYKIEDAVSSLFFGSLCSGKINLQTALLRSRGIPARVLIVTTMFYETKGYWADSHHYIGEAYFPNYGWFQLQSGKIPSPPKFGIVMRIATPEDEDLAGDGFSEYGGIIPWFWIDNKNVVLGIPDEMMYKLPKNKKTGVPAIKGWTECKFKISTIWSEKIISTSKELWELFTKNLDGNISTKNLSRFKQGFSLHKEAIIKLRQSQFNDYLKITEEVKKIYTDLLKK